MKAEQMLNRQAFGRKPRSQILSVTNLRAFILPAPKCAASSSENRSIHQRILSVAKLRLADVLDAEHRAVAPSQTKIVGKMTFGDALAIFRERQKQHATDVKDSTKKYNERAAIDLLKTWAGLEQMDVKRITKFDCLEWRSRFGKKCCCPYGNKRNAFGSPADSGHRRRFGCAI